jgi:hypothetical protein
LEIKHPVSGKDSKGNLQTKTYDVLRFLPYHNSASNGNNGYKTIAEKPFMSGLTKSRSFKVPDYNESYEIHNTYSPENGGFIIEGNFMLHDGPDDLNNDYGWGGAGCIEVCGPSGFEDLKNFIYSLTGSTDSIGNALNDLTHSGNLLMNIEDSVSPPPCHCWTLKDLK